MLKAAKGYVVFKILKSAHSIVSKAFRVNPDGTTNSPFENGCADPIRGGSNITNCIPVPNNGPIIPPFKPVPNPNGPFIPPFDPFPISKCPVTFKEKRGRQYIVIKSLDNVSTDSRDFMFWFNLFTRNGYAIEGRFEYDPAVPCGLALSYPRESPEFRPLFLEDFELEYSSGNGSFENPYVVDFEELNK